MVDKKILEAILNSEHSDLYCSALIEEINKQVDTDDEPFRKKGRALIRAILKNDIDGVLMALCGWSPETLLNYAGILHSNDEFYVKEECDLKYAGQGYGTVYVEVLVDPTTFEVFLPEGVLSDLIESENRGIVPTVLYREHELPVYSHKNKDLFGHPVFWFYEAQYAITRPIDGVTVNGIEYCLDENGEIMLFPSMLKAKEYLASQGYSEVTIRAEGIDIVEYSEKNEIPFGNATLADKVNQIIKLTGEVMEITGGYNYDYRDNENDVLNEIENLLTVYRNTLGKSKES